VADSENNLSVGVVVDVSGLTTGTAQVSSAVEEMAGRIRAAFGSVEKAPEGVQNAFAVMRNSSRQSAQVVTDAVNSLNQALTVVPPKAAAAGSSIDRAMQTAAARIFVTEAGLGRMGLALSRVGIASGVLGPIFSAAFPVLAVIGIISLLDSMIEKLDKLRDREIDMALSWDEVGHSVTEFNNQLTRDLERAAVELTRITRGPLAAFDQEIRGVTVNVDALYQHIKQGLTAFESEISKEGGTLGLLQLAIFGAGGVGAVESKAKEVQHAVQQALEAGDTAKAQQIINAALAETLERKKQLEDSDRAIVEATEQQVELIGNLATSHTKEIEGYTKLHALLEQINVVMQKSVDLTKAQQEVLGAEKTKTGNAEALKDEISLMRAKNETALHTVELITSTSLTQLETLLRIGKQDAESWEKWQKEKALSSEKHARESIAAWKREADESMHSAINLAKFAMEIDDSRFEHQHKMGEINEQQMIDLKKKALAEELALDIAAINHRIAALSATDPDSPAQTKKLLDEKLKLEQQYQLAVQKLDQTAAEVRRKEFEKFFSEINKPMEGAIKGIIMGTERVNVAFRRMGAEIVSSITQSLAMAAVRWAEHWAILELLTITGNASIAAAQGLANSKKVFSDAYTAAANAYAAVPFPLNLVVAPTVFALVAALGSGAASAAGGMVVPSDDMMAFLHKNEVVLPASIAKKFTDAAPGGGGGQIHVHMHNHFLDGNDAQKFLDRHSTRISRTIGKKLRGMGVGSR
jgi:hypothetical protein